NRAVSRSPMRFNAWLKPVVDGPYPPIRMRIGRPVALAGACWALAVRGLPSVPPTAPAASSAEAFKNRRLDMRSSAASRGCGLQPLPGIRDELVEPGLELIR